MSTWSEISQSLHELRELIQEVKTELANTDSVYNRVQLQLFLYACRATRKQIINRYFRHPLG